MAIPFFLQLIAKALSKYRVYLFICFLSSFALAVEKNLHPLMVKRIVDCIAMGNSESTVNDIYFYVIIAAVAQLFVEVMFRIQGATLAYIYPGFQSSLRELIFDKLLNKKLDFFAQKSIGRLSAQIYNLPSQSKQILRMTFDIFFPSFFSIAVTAIIISTISPTITILYFSWILFHLITSFFLATGCKQRAYIHDKSVNLLQGKMIDFICNIFSVKMFASSERERELFVQNQANEIKNNKSMLVFSEYMKAILGFLTVCEFTIIMFKVIDLWSKQLISGGDIIFIISSIGNSSFILWIISIEMILYFQVLGSCQVASELLSDEGDFPDQSCKLDLDTKEGKIEFKNVCFSYDNGNIFALKNINLTINSGEKIAVVGCSGSGKTTLIRALTSYKECISGSIHIDGQNIHDCKFDSIVKCMTFVPQEIVLFHRTIRENICYSNPDASYEEMVEVSKLACCHDFIMKLNDGYETVIGGDDSSINLSVGQRQRIAIARAMLLDLQIVILDEISASLDNITETKIKIAISNLIQNKTSIIIMHRLSSISIVDKIVVMKDGFIVGYGTHEDLISNNKEYMELWQKDSNAEL